MTGFRHADRLESKNHHSVSVMPDWMSLMKETFYLRMHRRNWTNPMNGPWTRNRHALLLAPTGSIAEATVAPVTDRLFELRGTPDPIRYVTISGLTLTQTQSTCRNSDMNFHSPLMWRSHQTNAEDCRIEDNFIHITWG
jgi:hypothetical protein